MALFIPSLASAVPTQIAQESFEGTVGSIGFTTSVPQFIELATSPLTDYFSVIPNDGSKVSGNRFLPGADGTKIFAAEDCDTPRTLPAVVGPQEVSLTTNSVSIAGKINNQVRLLMAAPGRDISGTVSLAEYENFLNSPLYINKLKIEASIDGGAFQRVVQFSPNVIDFPAQLSFDADGNDVGGDVNPIGTNPTTLDATLREGIYSIPTGNTVQIRVTFESDATGELIAFDNIRIFGENSATNPPVLAGVPATNLTFTEGSSATAIAPAITVADSDSANLASASVSITQNYVNGEDILAATPSGAILAGDIVFNAATGSLTISRSATKASYQAVLRSVTYRNTNLTAPSTAARRITFSASDGTNPSNSPIRDITVVDAIVTQSLPFVESWETDGRGTRYAVDGGFSAPPSMFARVQPGAVTGLDGTFAWGVENVDNNANFTELVTFNLNASGLVNLSGELRVAAGGGPNYDGGTVPDFLRVEASADGGPFQNVLAFYSDAAAQGNMRQDNSPGDATNVGDGTLLTAALQTFTFNLPTATTLTVRIRAFTNIVGENILFDRLAVTGEVPPLIVTNASDSSPGSLRAIIATALAQTGPNTIKFDPAVFDGEAVDTIGLSSPLSISDAGGVIIDASDLPAGVTISGNNVTRIFNVATGAVVTLRSLTLTGGNSGGAAGGAITSTGNLTLKGCTLVGNTATNGGGAIASFNTSGSLQLENCTMGGNTANFGGAIWSNNAPFSLHHCTISNNNGNGGTAGIVIEGSTGSITNCIIAGNVTTNSDRDIGGAGTVVTRAGSNLFGVPAGSYASLTTPGLPNANGDYVGTLAAPLLPRLGPLARNGGAAPTMVPLLSSPVRDRIVTTTLTTDQRGIRRPQWGATDIGAVEAGIQADCAWEVRDVFTSPVTTLGNLANTDLLLANPAATQLTGVFPTVNFSDLNGSPNDRYFSAGSTLFLSDNLTPQGLSNQDDNNFATQARAYLTITTAGDYTFGFAGDDGGRLRLFSTNGSANPVFTSSTRVNPTNPANPAHVGNTLTFDAPTGNSDTLGVANLAPGVYGVEFTMWEDAGGAGGEVFFATGAKTAVDGSFTLLGGENLTHTPGIARPLNDDFAAAMPLSGAVVRTASCNAGATLEPGEPVSVPNEGSLRTKSVWWTWTAPVTAGYQVDTIGSNFDTVLAFLTGSSVNGLTELAFSDDADGSFTSKLSFGAVAGTVYRIQVSGFNSLEGTIQLNIGPAANFTPSFTKGANQSVFTNAGPQTVSGWAASISPGASWETTQAVNFIVATTNPGLFVGTPTVSPDGTLSYVPAPTAGGTATVSVSLQDNGSPVLTSAVQTFTITTSLTPTTGTTLTINAGGTGTGTAAVVQDFNTVSSASGPWVDNSTVPSWYAQINDGATASGTFQPSSGTVALNGLINCGSTTAPTDRALGSKAASTSGLANISYAVVIRNVGNLPVKLSRLRYAEELWRSGSVANMTEKITPYYAVSDAPLTSLASGPSAGAAVAGAGFTALPGGASTQISSTTINTALDGNLALNRSAVDYLPLPADGLTAILPGQYLTLKWTDPNESAGTDGHQAIDDVTLDFAEIPCAIYASVSNVVRKLVGGTTDTVDFTLTVAGAGSGLSASGWSLTAPTAPTALATTGNYGVPKSFTNVPLSAFTPSALLSIRDAADVNCTTTATVSVPLVLGINYLNTTYLQASTAPTIFRQTQATGLTANEVTMDPGSAVLTTDSVAVAPGTEKCLVLEVEATDTSTNSGFEVDDTLKVELISTLPSGALVIETLTDDFDLNKDGVISGGATPLADELNLEQKTIDIKWTSKFILVGTVPAEAVSFRLRITAAILGNVAATTSEVFRFKQATLRVCNDADLDGRYDEWEVAHGTGNATANSHFGISNITKTSPTTVTLNVRTDNLQARTYQVLTSPNLLTWTRDGLPTLVPGSNPTAWPLLPINRTITGPKYFYRVLVQVPQVVLP